MTAATSVFAARPGDIAFGESTLKSTEAIGAVGKRVCNPHGFKPEFGAAFMGGGCDRYAGVPHFSAGRKPTAAPRHKD
ncbi:MAG TPA: hypothetical protein VHY10_17125 [Xanthobacteraceae bacterium]|jgi:hypothetical protein|nr:hypothetical protein [Xanthobacteraceae bacterium]